MLSDSLDLITAEIQGSYIHEGEGSPQARLLEAFAIKEPHSSLQIMVHGYGREHQPSPCCCMAV